MTPHRFIRLLYIALISGASVLSSQTAKADPKVDAAVSLAKQIITDAQQNASFVNSLYGNQHMSLILSSVKEVLVPEYFALPDPRQEFPYCIENPGVAAFTIWPGTLEKMQGEYATMGICRRALVLNERELSELAIHEAIHFSLGETNECTVTEIEIKIMKAAGLLPFKNGYVDLCYLSALGPFSENLVL